MTADTGVIISTYNKKHNISILLTKILRNEWLVAGILILVAAVLNQIPLIISILRAPPGIVFLGAVHHPNDYFYYLSQFASGQTHFLRSFDPMTTEYRGLTFIGWPNVLMGHLTSLLGIGLIPAYHLWIFVLSLLFLFLSYCLIRKIFPDTTKRILCLSLFLFTHSFPQRDFWFNLGNPLTRLGAVPHHLLLNTAIVFILLSFLRSLEHKKSVPAYLGLIIGSVLLVSTNPVQWVFVGLILGMYAIPVLSQLLIPLLAYFLSGIPIAMYLRNMFLSLPYSQLSAWEASTNQYRLHFSTFMWAYGLVGILALLSLPILFRKKQKGALVLLALYGLGSLAISYSPLPTMVHIGFTRFVSSTSVLFLSVSSVLSLQWLGHRTHRSTLVYIIALNIMLLLFIPAFVAEVKEKTRYFEPGNAYMYLPRATVEGFAKARQFSTEDDAFLVIWPYNISFAGLTGRREFNGHPLLTVDSQTKDNLAQHFFDGTMTPADMENLLRSARITYVIAYPWTFHEKAYPFLMKFQDIGTLTMYKTKLREKLLK